MTRNANVAFSSSHCEEGEIASYLNGEDMADLHDSDCLRHNQLASGNLNPQDRSQWQQARDVT